MLAMQVEEGLGIRKGGIVVKEIQLTRGKVALVDDADYDLVNSYKWFAYKSYRNTYYACRSVTLNGKKTIVSMHGFLMNTPKGMETDHKDADGLNNQRNNIRVCTHAENQHNQCVQARNKSSLFKGVSWMKRQKRWRARIKIDKKFIYLGSFTDEIDAAQAYDDAANALFGDYAKPNIILGGE